MATHDFDLAIVGAGSAGMAAARRGASNGLSVVLFESDEVGGTCVNRGCVPKKLLVTASRQGDAIKGAAAFGWSAGDASFDWPTLRDAVRAQVRTIEGSQSDGLEEAGVTLVGKRVQLAGDGRLVSAEGDDEWRAADIVIATGSRPLVPDLPGAELALVSDDLFTLEALPKRLALVGGGYIAVEFANLMQRFGVEVSVFGPHEQVLDGFDAEVVGHLQDAMTDAGIELVNECRVSAVEAHGEGLRRLRIDGADDRDGFDAVALVVGRAPNVEDIGLEGAGVTLTDRGQIEVDGHFRTSADHVYAVGDVVAKLQLTPVAIEQGRSAVAAILGETFGTTREEHVPTGVYSTPECGAVGLTERAATELGIEHEIRRADFRPLDDVLAAEARNVVVKLVVERTTGRLLGFHAFDAHATELAQLAAMAVRAGLTEHDLHRTMALHPTRGEEIVGLGRPEGSLGTERDRGPGESDAASHARRVDHHLVGRPSAIRPQ